MASYTKAFAVSTLFALGLSACADGTTAPERAAAGRPSLSTDATGQANVTANWNLFATALQARRPAPPVMRMYTYLALAQLRAAEDARSSKWHRSQAAAIGGASAAFLTSRFDFAAAEIQDSLDAQALRTADSKHEDFEAAAAMGRAAAERVMEYALDDRVNLGDPGLPPTTPGHWIYSTPVKFAYKARPFFLVTGDEVRPPPPPVFGSDEYKAALEEVYQISINRTPEMITIARYWAANQSLASDAAVNNEAVRLIRKYGTGDAEAARIFFLMNAAGFDASIGCYQAKYHYWYIRPGQADSRIVTIFPAPAHPSYPSGHSCHSGSTTGVLAAVFPDETENLRAMAEQAGLSRLYAGIHYRFDMEAGRALGRAVAAEAMRANLNQVAVR